MSQNDESKKVPLCIKIGPDAYFPVKGLILETRDAEAGIEYPPIELFSTQFAPGEGEAKGLGSTVEWGGTAENSIALGDNHVIHLTIVLPQVICMQPPIPPNPPGTPPVCTSTTPPSGLSLTAQVRFEIA